LWSRSACPSLQSRKPRTGAEGRNVFGSMRLALRAARCANSNAGLCAQPCLTRAHCGFISADHCLQRSHAAPLCPWFTRPGSTSRRKSRYRALALCRVARRALASGCVFAPVVVPSSLRSRSSSQPRSPPAQSGAPLAPPSGVGHAPAWPSPPLVGLRPLAGASRGNAGPAILFTRNGPVAVASARQSPAPAPKTPCPPNCACLPWQSDGAAMA
jgi:hypothetical protein